MGLLDLIRPLWSIFTPKKTARGSAADATNAGASGGDFLDDLKADLESSVDSIFADGPIAGTDQPPMVSDEQAPRELFAGIAANYSQPVRDFMAELERGTATKDWIEITMPVMGSLIHGAESVGLHDVAERMIEFREALTMAESSPGNTFDEDSRRLIGARFRNLADALPEAFGKEEQEVDPRRDSIIIHSLLRQIPDVGHVTLEKLYSAGLTSLDALFLANEHDMSVTTGVPLWLCERICHKIAEHRRELEGGSPEQAPLEHRAKLEQLVGELRGHQTEFQRISEVGRESLKLAADKRECLRRRQSCALQINVLLAEMGELALVEELRKMGVERRIDRLDEYLTATAQPVAVPMTENTTPIQGVR